MTSCPADLPTVVGAAIVDDPARPTALLAARRKAPKSLAGYWEFPGGKIEDGESLHSALRREISEELGVKIEILDAVAAPDNSGWPLANGMRMHVLFATITDGDPQPLTEHDRLEWVPLDQDSMHELKWIPADFPIVDEILAHLQHGLSSSGE